jgi:hypothetical protein
VEGTRATEQYVKSIVRGRIVFQRKSWTILEFVTRNKYTQSLTLGGGEVEGGETYQ